MPRFGYDDISVYIFNWHKVTKNSVNLYKKIRPLIRDTWIVNCDEHKVLDISCIQLDDSHYYGSQYNHAIKHIRPNAIMCVIVGDNVCSLPFNRIFKAAITTFNNFNVGVYAPNDRRSLHKGRGACIANNLYDVENTDCGFWFIHPSLIASLRGIDYSISKYGWGIDTITIKEARRRRMYVMRDYDVFSDQLNYECGYASKENEARVGWKALESIYLQMLDNGELPAV